MILQGGDGGDSAANLGTYHVYCETRRRMGHQYFTDGQYQWREVEDFEIALKKLQRASWLFYRRHPDESFWGSRVNTMSRDQTIPLLSAMALYGMREHVFLYMFGHALRLFLFTTNTTPNWTYPNQTGTLTWWEKVKFFFGWKPSTIVYGFKLPDLTTFEFWALELRGLYHWTVWPLFFPILCALDLFTLISSADKVYFYGQKPGQSDDRNHINVLLVGLQVCWTPVMWLAARLYCSRPHAANARLEANGVQSALDHYYRADNSPPFNVLAEPIVKQYFT